MNFRYGKKEIEHLKSRDRRLGEVIGQIGHIRWTVEPDLFAAIVQNIVSQQISGNAAASILARVEAALGEVTPKSVARADALVFRKCGIGVWTAEMLLLFTLQRPDILSYGDLGIQRGMRMVYRHRKITKKLFAKYRRRLSPYGSVASLYFWMVAGGAIPDLEDPAGGTQK